MCMNLKPQDIFVALKLVAMASPRWTYVQLANELFMSASEINASIKRGIKARLIADVDRDKLSPRPIRKALEEFIIHGVKYAFPPDRGELVRGIPTGYAAPPLEDQFIPSNDPPPVWPDPEGKIRGYSFSPLYKSVPKAAKVDKKLYMLLVLVDAIRDGRAREKEIAIKEIHSLFADYKIDYKKENI